MVHEDTLELVEYSDWAAPTVAVLKQVGKHVRICADFKQTVNPVSKLDIYSIPHIEDLFSQLSDGKSFIKFDLSQAYLQIPLEDAQKGYYNKYAKGLFRYIQDCPMVFLGILQRLMENEYTRL